LAGSCDAQVTLPSREAILLVCPAVIESQCMYLTAVRRSSPAVLVGKHTLPAGGQGCITESARVLSRICWMFFELEVCACWCKPTPITLLIFLVRWREVGENLHGGDSVWIGNVIANGAVRVERKTLLCTVLHRQGPFHLITDSGSTSTPAF